MFTINFPREEIHHLKNEFQKYTIKSRCQVKKNKNEYFDYLFYLLQFE